MINKLVDWYKYYIMGLSSLPCTHCAKPLYYRISDEANVSQQKVQFCSVNCLINHYAGQYR